MTNLEIKKYIRAFYREVENKRLYNEKYIFGIKKDFDSALWFYHENTNYILVGDRALENFTNGTTLKEKILENLLYHEFGHSLYSSRNTNISKTLESLKIPFSLYNLFEDIRMEKKVEENLVYSFNFSLYMKKHLEVSHPEGILQNLLDFGESNDEVKNGFINEYNLENPEAERSAEDIYKKVVEFYYPKIIKAESSEDLFYLMTLWIREFYPENEDKQDDALNEIDELLKALGGEGLSKDLKELSREEKEDLIKDIEVCISSFIEDEIKNYVMNIGEVYEDDELSNKSFSGCNTTTVVSSSFEISPLKGLKTFNSKRYDRNKAKKLLPKLSKILNTKTISKATKKPTKRFHTRNLINDREKVYKVKEESRKKRKIASIVLDCSGSMRKVMTDMKLVIGLFNQLAIEGKIIGNLILSSTIGYETILLPMKDSDIDKIGALFAAEGLQETMTNNLNILKKSDFTFVLTDGDIGDDPIDKSFFRLHKVNTIGMYVGEKKDLTKWFEKSISRHTVEGLIDQLIRIIK